MSPALSIDAVVGWSLWRLAGEPDLSAGHVLVAVSVSSWSC